MGCERVGGDGGNVERDYDDENRGQANTPGEYATDIEQDLVDGDKREFEVDLSRRP